MNTDVEDLLREGMERFTADLRAPVGLARQAARRRRRRLALRSGAGAALTACAVALAAAVTVVAVVVPGGRLGGTDLTSYVVKRVNSALSAAEPGEIARMTVTTRSAMPFDGKTVTTTSEEWSYGTQWRSVTNSSAGRPVYDEGFSTASVYTLVSYQTRTWARQPGVGRPAAPVSGPHGCGPAVAALPPLLEYGLPGLRFAAGSPATVARAMRAAISCGTLAVAGRQRVNGIDAIELTSRPGSLISETIWVSPGTYLPVRVVIHSGPGHPALLQQTANISWLAPTAQNLAMLTVPIPAGFRKVAFAEAVSPVLRQIPGGAGSVRMGLPGPGGLALLGPGPRWWPRPGVRRQLPA